MKFRTDFVTNSSSSSFVCDICGDVETGYDMGLEEAGMYRCENGHTFCESHMEGSFDEKTLLISLIGSRIEEYQKSNNERRFAWIDDEKALLNLVILGEKDDEIESLLEDYDFRHECPASICPICSFTSLRDSDARNYLMILNELSNKQVLANLKKEFGTYENFSKYIDDGKQKLKL